MNEAIFSAINAAFPLTKKDAGAYAAFRAKPLSVQLDWYAAEGLGNVSFLHGKAMGGLMRMDTLVVNAVYRDVPLFSYDRIDALGNRTMLVEYYDTLLDQPAFDGGALTAAKALASGVPAHDLGAHWYDGLKLPASFAVKAKKAHFAAMEAAFDASLRAYLALAKAAAPLDAAAAAEKRQKGAAYVNGLLERGGPSTDAFQKALGADRTRELFTRIVFGTEA